MADEGVKVGVYSLPMHLQCIIINTINSYTSTVVAKQLFSCGKTAVVRVRAR